MRCSTCTEPAVGYANQRPYCVVHLGDLGYGAWDGYAFVAVIPKTPLTGGDWVTLGATRVAADSDDRERNSDAAFLRSLGIEP